MPCIGIHHHNALNNFNLADDLIEPLRCIVDNYVLENINNIKELDVSVKSNLINLLYYEITWNENTYALNYAIKLYVKSFKSALEKENAELLIIPKFSKSEVLK